ncbi:MAG: MFS transporter [Gemmatimonadales bacterium]
MLGLLALAELLGMGGWLAGGALAGELSRLWSLTPGQVGWLTSIVQLGFVVGTLAAAVLNLPDLVPSRRFFAVNATLAAIANALLLVWPSYRVALLTRFFVGLFLAGVYPPAMKMAATWFRHGRGFAIGVVIGALTIGKASPYLVEALGGLGVEAVIGTTAAGTLLAALLVAVGYRDGPLAFPRRPFSWRLVGEVLRVPEMRLATAGYLGHMWELYAFWASVALFWSASLTRSSGGAAPRTVAALTFVSIAIGVVGCVAGGRLADLRGRERVVLGSLAVSGLSALASPLVFGGPTALVLALMLVWGVAVIADSAQFSAIVTEVAPPHAVGTALTLQTSLGFLLTTATLQLVPVMAASWGPRWAFPVLSLGPAAGIVAIRRLRRIRGLAVPAT